MQEYVDSAAFTGALTTITLDKSVDTIYSTCVPNRVDGVSVTWYRLSGVGGDPLGVGLIAGLVRKLYKDVDVLELPGGRGWLMVLTRYLAEESTGSVDPANSLAQIVAWWSDNEDFTGQKVVGPFLLVDGCQCWSVDQGIRLWVGVPGVVCVENDEGNDYDMYVYYAVDECDLGHTRPSVPTGTPTSIGTSTPSDILRDDISKRDYNTELTRLEFEPGIAVKRFALSEFLTAVQTEYAEVTGMDPSSPASSGRRQLTAEDDWTPDTAFSGTLLGPVRFFFADTSTGTTTLLDFFDYYTTADLRLADPAPVTCGTSLGELSLYTAQIGGSSSGVREATPAAAVRVKGSGHGLWRGRAMQGGVFYHSAARTASYLTVSGKDFVLANLHKTTYVSPDQIAEGGNQMFTYNDGTTKTDPHVQWVDPDPVQMPDGTWWVAAGVGSIGYLSAFLGTPDEGCAGAAEVVKTGSNRLFTDTMTLPPPPMLAEARPSAALTPNLKSFARPKTAHLESVALTQSESTSSGATYTALPADAYIAKLRSRVIAAGNQ